jgi:hypothetical protein
MLLQAVICAYLEAIEDFSVGPLDLSITLWMSNGRIADFDVKILTVSLECTTGELGPIVGDDPVRNPKPADDGLDELDCGLFIDLDRMCCFCPLGELVNDNIQIPESSDSPRK